MKLSTYFKGIIFITFIALVYIHMQMRIYELAYKGKDKENRIHELSDTYGRLSHDILTLKSSQHLGNILMDREGAMKFMGKDNVMTYSVPQASRPQVMQGTKVQQSFWQMLSMITTSEAKAGE